MNDFFDRLGNAARRAAGTVAGEVSIAAEKQKLSDAYRALGKLCYEATKQDASLVCDEQIARIDAILARLEELKTRRNVEPNVTPAADPETTTAPITADETDFVIVEE
jgi:hypothetical protein